MLIFPKSLLSLWAKAVATACYTQNRLLIHPRYNKTPNELLRDCKPELKYLHVFGALCYLTNDSKDLGKLKPKADIRIFIAGVSSSTTIDQDSPSPSTSPNNETIASLINSTNIKQLNNEEDAEFNSDTFTNPFAPSTTSSAESSSKIVDTSNTHTFQQPHINTRRWTKDHPLVTIIGNPSKPDDVNLLLMPYGAIFMLS
ncbi:retrovirus-related pol polyprotein from transposon TNT 1-94 [Tanacetum coccineum]